MTPRVVPRLVGVASCGSWSAKHSTSTPRAPCPGQPGLTSRASASSLGRSTPPRRSRSCSPFIHLLAPSLGGPAGLPLDALIERLVGVGFDRTFLDRAAAAVAPGSSALVVLSSDVDLELVRPVVEHALAHGDVTLLKATVTPEAPAALLEVARDVGSKQLHHR